MYHVITGNGKGKTTAALGMAVRAAGAGMSVFIAQFVKGKPYAEHKTIEQIAEIDYELMGRRCFIEKDPEPEDIQKAQEGWAKVKKKLKNNEVDLLILDELHIAHYYHLLDDDNVITTINEFKNKVEIVSTGRYAPDFLIEMADLVSEVKEIKHYYTQGVEARKGIEF